MDQFTNQMVTVKFATQPNALICTCLRLDPAKNYILIRTNSGQEICFNWGIIETVLLGTPQQENIAQPPKTLYVPNGSMAAKR